MRVKYFLTALWALILIACAPDPVRVTNITLNTQAITLEIGDSEQLIATVSPHDAANTTVLWSSDNSSVAKVSMDGTVTAVAPGTAKITAKSDDGGMSDVCVVTVPEPFTDVTLDRTSISMYEGGTDQLKATIAPADAEAPSLLWSSSNPDVVFVTPDGKLFAIAPGSADITVTIEEAELSATCQVTVQEVIMELKPPTLDIAIDDEADIEVSLEKQLEGVSVNVRWYSTDVKIITVDDKGHVKALATGDAIICAATDKGRIAFCKVHVREKVESVTITASSADAYLGGDPTQLTATVTPADLPDLKITWSSSDASVATVDSKGAVTAQKKGTVTITVTVENGTQTVTQSREMQVIQPVTSISVDPTTLELYVDDVLEISESLTIKMEPADADDTSCKYSTSTAGIISVSSQGKITGKKAGTVKLYITPNKANPSNLKATCTVTVKAKVASVTVTPSEKSMQVGQTYTLTAKVSPSNANQDVTWSSSDTKVASVAADGKVTAIKAGEAVITATSKDNPEIKSTCVVTVVNIPVESVTLNKTTLLLVEGKSETLTATVKPDNVLDKTVTWSSSDTKVATVTSAGKITAVKEGTANITATCGGKTATCVVTVDPQVVAVTSVSLDKETITIDKGSTGQLTATVLPERASNKSVTWSSSNTSIVSVSSVGNVATLTGKAAGEAVVTVKTADGNFTKECKVTVVIPVSSITLSQTAATIEFGQTLTLNATVLPTNASSTAIAWSSDKPEVASVSEDGVVTGGTTAGTAKITATCGGKTATCTVTVKAEIVLVNKVTISPRSLNLSLNQQATVKATVSPSNADNKSIVWSVPQGAVITVDQSGTVTAVKEGSCRLIAKSADGNASDFIVVTVTKKTVTGLTLTPATLTLKVGETYDLVAKVTPSDASIPDISFTSSGKTIASVNEAGRVTALKPGTVTITAKSVDVTSIKKTCTVTVLESGASSGGAEGIDFEDWNFN